MTKFTRRALLASTLAVTFAAAGCHNQSGTGGKRDSAAGVASGSRRVPSDARRVGESAHSPLIRRVDNPGMIWVEDVTTGKVVYAGTVRAASNIAVDPKADAIAVNDIQVKHPRLDTNHTYRLSYKPQ